jgi:hypothetical protein
MPERTDEAKSVSRFPSAKIGVQGRRRDPGSRRRRGRRHGEATTSLAAAGGHAITAVYSGDPNFAGSSQALTEQVNAPTTPWATATSLMAPANPAVVGRAVTFTATVRGPAGTGTPTGTVTFFVGDTVVARVPLDANGQARLTRSFSRTGPFAIRAVYSGDAGFAASSQSLTEQVNRS